MSLFYEQSEFSKDLHKLLGFLIDRNIKFSIGEVYRTRQQQNIYVATGLSQTWNSMHLKKLAVDLNIIIDNALTYSKKDLQFVGDYWTSLNSKNRWGGNFHSFVDSGHFERHV